MPSDEFKRAVRRDVAMAVGQTIVEESPFERNNFTWDIIPAKEPMAGFGASTAFWSYVLGVVKGRLHRKYPGFKVTPSFMRLSRRKSLTETVTAITLNILSQIDDEEGGVLFDGGSNNDE